jgi:hypothetical protein
MRGISAEPQSLLVAALQSIQSRIEHTRVTLDFVDNGRDGYALIEMFRRSRARAQQ